MKQKYRKLLKELEEASDHNDMLSQRVKDLNSNYKILQDTLANRDDRINTLSNNVTSLLRAVDDKEIQIKTREEGITSISNDLETARAELSKLVTNLDTFKIGGIYQLKEPVTSEKNQERLKKMVTTRPPEAMDKL